MDFVEGLPSSGGKNCILVVVDRFSKYAHFLPLAHPYTALSVAKLFLQQVYRLHGLLDSIVFIEIGSSPVNYGKSYFVWPMLP